MRNPKWHRDEIILALDLYFNNNRSIIDHRNPKVIELSELLNKLPLFTNRPDAEKFRNANGVSLKLSNFLALDPTYNGKGMQSYSNLDKEIFDEFVNQKEKLHSIATEIKNISSSDILKSEILTIEDDEETINDAVVEGQLLYKLHKVRERNSKIIRLKKEQVWHLTGHLECEVCIFDFEKFYGDIGSGFMECHHLTPLYNFKTETKTTINDLALVCSNCHRIIHKSIDTVSFEQLKEIARKNNFQYGINI